MWVITLGVIFVSIVLIYLWYLNKEKYRDIQKIRGPPVKFLFGNALEFGNNITDLFYSTQRIIKTYGPLVRIWMGPFRLYLFITDLKYVEYFMSSKVHIKKSSSYDTMKPWIGDGLITSTGDTWRRGRKMLTPAFHFQVLDRFTNSFHRYGNILVNSLKREEGKVVDLYNFMTLYAMDVICDSAMNIDAKVQENSDTVYIDATQGFTKIFFIRFFSILQRYDFFFKLSSNYERQKQFISSLLNFTGQVIQQRKEERKKEQKFKSVDAYVNDIKSKKKKAFLDILLDNNELTDQEIREQVDTFLFAGHDTLASALSFGLFELAKHSDVQQTMLEEIEAVVGTDKNTIITVKHLQQMDYLDRVVKETLRIRPPVPMVERELEEDVLIDEMKIPKGTTVTFQMYAQHHDEKLFPDPEKFDTDRFLPENVAQRHPFAYIPFSAGPRNCIGSRYAMLNVKTTFTNIVRNFVLHPVVPAHEVIYGNAAVLKSINGLPVILEARK